MPSWVDLCQIQLGFYKVEMPPPSVQSTEEQSSLPADSRTELSL